MTHWTYVAKTSEITPGQGVTVASNGQCVAVFNTDGRYYAVSNVCPHAAGPLVNGVVDEGRIICPWHGWAFVLDPDDAPNDGLPRYPVKIENGHVYVRLPGETAPTQD